ncbi:MAG TPA: neutral zinc metallopeptidase [Anaeromyxobacteraceae bacterium]|nr:neutral zinc metallopeptidase [Anaeromyxobacteraceae bacterium]
MRLDDGDRTNVEDRRGAFAGGGGTKLGIGGVLVLAVLSVLFKQDLFALLGSAPMQGAAQASPQQVAERQAAEADLERTAVASFNDAQRVWGQAVDGYRPAKLVLFWDEVRSGCGDAAAEMGPFYCPADHRVYIDLGFYRELADRFGAPGQFAQAYVIAHEVGHHLQSLLGISQEVRDLQRRDPGRRNALSVLLELQADCFAGAWGKAAQDRGLLDPGDVEQGLAAAAAIGDDRIQRTTTGRVSPESFTHGSSAQRSRWFRAGLESGSLKACDTFRR